MVGAYLGYVDKNHKYLNKRSVKNFKMNLLKSAGGMFLVGFVAPVDNLAHLGGFLGGYGYGRLRCLNLGGRRIEKVKRSVQIGGRTFWEGARVGVREGRRSFGGGVEGLGRLISPNM